MVSHLSKGLQCVVSFALIKTVGLHWFVASLVKSIDEFFLQNTIETHRILIQQMFCKFPYEIQIISL